MSYENFTKQMQKLENLPTPHWYAVWGEWASNTGESRAFGAAPQPRVSVLPRGSLRGPFRFRNGRFPGPKEPDPAPFPTPSEGHSALETAAAPAAAAPAAAAPAVPSIAPGERFPVIHTTLARRHSPETERSTGDDAIWHASFGWEF